MKIALDAGHGINTAGKRTPDGIREWTLNDRVLKGFETEIKQYQGVTVTRLDDATGITDVPLVTRTNKAKDCDVLLSFHHNAYQSVWGSHGGSEAWVYQGRKSEDLAKVLLQATVDTLGLRNRGVKQGNLHINREFAKVSVLMEIGFMDSTTDKIILEEKESALVGKNMAIAFARYYKLSKEDKPVEKPSEPKGTYKEKGRFTCKEKVGIITRDYPSTASTRLGQLSYNVSFDYDRVFIGNGFVWVSNGKVWIPTGQASNGKRNGKVWGVFGSQTVNKPVQPPKPKLRDGAKVQIKSSATKYVTGQTIPARYKNVTYTVQQVKPDKVLIKELMSWVYIKDITVVG